MQRQAPHRVGGVELLGDGDEGDTAGIERLDDPGEVRERAGQAIHLVDDDQIDLPLPDVGPTHGQQGLFCSQFRGWLPPAAGRAGCSK